MTSTTTDRNRRSIKLTSDELKELNKFIKRQPTKFDAALIIGITRPTLDRILVFKSCYQDSYDKILKVLGTASDRREEERATA